MISDESITRLLLNGPVEKGTRARILDVSIDLFAQKGFDAVSVQEIADAVGIRKASLYYHFSSKDQILQSILEYPVDLMKFIGLQDAGAEERILSMGVAGFMDMSRDIALRWMDSPYVEKIMRIIFVELYHNDQVKAFWSSLVGLAEAFWVHNFTIMIEKGLIRPLDPKALASTYLSYYSHAWVDYFLIRYGHTAGSFREEHEEDIGMHTRFLVDLVSTG